MKPVHFAQLPDYKARKRGKHRAVFYRDNSLGRWSGMTWNELDERIELTAAALAAYGIEPQANVGICSANKPHCLIVDFANFANRAVSVPMHATMSAEQMAYIVNDTAMPLLFVGDQQQYDKALEAMRLSACLKQIVAFDSAIDLRGEARAMHFARFMETGRDAAARKTASKRRRQASGDDLAIILYTSGTTGEPKGVMIRHRQLLEAMRMNARRFPTITHKDRAVSFLPLSHIFERTFVYLLLNTDTKIYLNEHPADVQQAVREVRPTLMCNVPRYWEKVAIAAHQHFEGYSAFKKGVAAWALAVGRDYNIDHLRRGKSPSIGLRLRYKAASLCVFDKLKKRVGIENGRLFPVAGAVASERLIIFFRSMGIPLFYGYGLTETCATVSVYDYRDYAIGSVGSVVDGIEVKIGDDNEILVRGATVTEGYYKKPEATRQAFADGWFRTGDMGRLDGRHLYMTDRLKDLFKTSNGKYIAPQQIETRLGGDSLFEQVAVIGDNRNFVTAIIAPNLETLAAYARKRRIRYERTEDLLANAEITAFVAERIAALQADMAEYEKIKRFRLIKNGFSIESGELTTTLKLRRAVIQQHYRQLIDDMYK